MSTLFIVEDAAGISKSENFGPVAFESDVVAVEVEGEDLECDVHDEPLDVGDILEGRGDDLGDFGNEESGCFFFPFS